MDNILFYEHDLAGAAAPAMVPFCEAIAKRHPGKVTAAFLRVDESPRQLTDAGAAIKEFPFADLVDFVRQNGIKHVCLLDTPSVSALYWKLRRAGVRSITVHRTAATSRPSLVKRVLAKFGPWRATAYLAASKDIRQQLHADGLPRRRCHLSSHVAVAVEVFEAATRS